MDDAFDAGDWTVQVSSLPHAVAEACAVAGLSPNAVELRDLAVVNAKPSASGAAVRCPSYFCDRTGFVLVLAYLVRNHLPFELEMFLETGRGGAAYRLHPALDPHSRALLAEIDPRQASEIADLQQRAAQVFERLRRGRLIEEG